MVGGVVVPRAFAACPTELISGGPPASVCVRRLPSGSVSRVPSVFSLSVCAARARASTVMGWSTTVFKWRIGAIIAYNKLMAFLMWIIVRSLHVPFIRVIIPRRHRGCSTIVFFVPLS